MHILSEHKCFDGLQLRVRHPSAANHCEMTYSLYLPPQALAGGRVPHKPPQNNRQVRSLK